MAKKQFRLPPWKKLEPINETVERYAKEKGPQFFRLRDILKKTIIESGVPHRRICKETKILPDRLKTLFSDGNINIITFEILCDYFSLDLVMFDPLEYNTRKKGKPEA